MEKKLRRRWVVRWYDFNLTEENSRKFFTEPAALLFAWWLEYRNEVKTWIYYE
jgi:hypothetical protein